MNMNEEEKGKLLFEHFESRRENVHLRLQNNNSFPAKHSFSSLFYVPCAPEDKCCVCPYKGGNLRA